MGVSNEEFIEIINDINQFIEISSDGQKQYLYARLCEIHEYIGVYLDMSHDAILFAEMPNSNDSISKLEISARSCNALKKAGVHTIEDIKLRLCNGIDSILAIPYFGEKALYDLLIRLVKYGYLECMPRQI